MCTTADLMREGKQEGINSQQSHHSQVIQSNLPQLVTFPLFFPSMKGINSQQFCHSQVIQSNLVRVHEP